MGAIAAFEKSDADEAEIPRMIMGDGKIGLENYIEASKNKVLLY